MNMIQLGKHAFNVADVERAEIIDQEWSCEGQKEKRSALLVIMQRGERLVISGDAQALLDKLLQKLV